MRYYHIPVFARFSWLNSRIVQKALRRMLPRHTRGRKGYDKLRLLLWLMYRQCMGCTYRDLESMTGIDYSTFIKFRRRLMKAVWFEGAFDRLSASLAPRLEDVIAVIDSSFVETYSGKGENGSGYSGYKEANGYKLHTLLDFRTRLPILQYTTAGNVHDITGGRYLVGLAPPSWKISALCADKGYDCEEFVMSVKERWRGSAVAIPVRKTRQKGDPRRNMEAKYRDRSRERSLYRKRTEIERYFSRKKHVFNLGEEKTRGLANFQANCLLTSIMEIMEFAAGMVQLFTKLLSRRLTNKTTGCIL